MGNEQMIPGL
jgi:hypothetical protein